ncbi:MAG TPA: hypothetical protein VF350_04840 [Candidatus Bathyarchaeia archaeon]
MKKKLSGQCICGYFFGTFENVKEAVVKVKLHFERYHEDFLPFGITDAEALALLKKGMSHGKKLVCSNNSCHLKQNRRIVQQMTN